MPFSTPEQVQKSYDFLHKMNKPACPGCARGVRMCHHTPCIGTPDDILKLLDAGYAKNLMLDWWIGETSKEESIKSSLGISKPTKLSKKDRFNPFEEDVEYIIPAIIGYEGIRSPFAKHGKCNLLINNQCSLHDKGLKPTQGSYACCKVENVWIDEDGKEQDIDERIPILHTWNTQKGRDVITRWKFLVSYDEEKDKGSNLPTSFPDMLDALMNVMTAHMKQYDISGTDGRPAIDPDEEVEVTKTIYEKPY